MYQIIERPKIVPRKCQRENKIGNNDTNQHIKSSKLVSLLKTQNILIAICEQSFSHGTVTSHFVLFFQVSFGSHFTHHHNCMN